MLDTAGTIYFPSTGQYQYGIDFPSLNIPFLSKKKKKKEKKEKKKIVATTTNNLT